MLRRVVLGRRHLPGQRIAHRIANPLTQRPRRRLHPWRLMKLRMPRSLRMQHPEIRHLLDRQIIPAQMQPPIKEHRPVTRRQNEPVPVQPLRLRRIANQLLPKQNRPNIRRPKRQTEVTGRALVDSIHGQTTGFIGSLSEQSVIHKRFRAFFQGSTTSQEAAKQGPPDISAPAPRSSPAFTPAHPKKHHTPLTPNHQHKATLPPRWTFPFKALSSQHEQSPAGPHRTSPHHLETGDRKQLR